MFHSPKAMLHIKVVLFVILVLGMVAFLGTGNQGAITGFQLYSEGNECATQLAQYSMSCSSPLSDIVTICKTSKLLEMCGTQQACIDVALGLCR